MKAQSFVSHLFQQKRYRILLSALTVLFCTGLLGMFSYIIFQPTQAVSFYSEAKGRFLDLSQPEPKAFLYSQSVTCSSSDDNKDPYGNSVNISVTLENKDAQYQPDAFLIEPKTPPIQDYGWCATKDDRSTMRTTNGKKINIGDPNAGYHFLPGGDYSIAMMSRYRTQETSDIENYDKDPATFQPLVDASKVGYDVYLVKYINGVPQIAINTPVMSVRGTKFVAVNTSYIRSDLKPAIPYQYDWSIAERTFSIPSSEQGVFELMIVGHGNGTSHYVEFGAVKVDCIRCGSNSIPPSLGTLTKSVEPSSTQATPIEWDANKILTYTLTFNTASLNVAEVDPNLTSPFKLEDELPSQFNPLATGALSGVDVDKCSLAAKKITCNFVMKKNETRTITVKGTLTKPNQDNTPYEIQNFFAVNGTKSNTVSSWVVATGVTLNPVILDKKVDNGDHKPELSELSELAVNWDTKKEVIYTVTLNNPNNVAVQIRNLQDTVTNAKTAVLPGSITVTVINTTVTCVTNMFIITCPEFTLPAKATATLTYTLSSLTEPSPDYIIKNSVSAESNAGMTPNSDETFVKVSKTPITPQISYQKKLISPSSGKIDPWTSGAKAEYEVEITNQTATKVEGITLTDVLSFNGNTERVSHTSGSIAFTNIIGYSSNCSINTNTATFTCPNLSLEANTTGVVRYSVALVSPLDDIDDKYTVTNSATVTAPQGVTVTAGTRIQNVEVVTTYSNNPITVTKYGKLINEGDEKYVGPDKYTTDLKFIPNSANNKVQYKVTLVNPNNTEVKVSMTDPFNNAGNAAITLSDFKDGSTPITCPASPSTINGVVSVSYTCSDITIHANGSKNIFFIASGFTQPDTSGYEVSNTVKVRQPGITSIIESGPVKTKIVPVLGNIKVEIHEGSCQSGQSGQIVTTNSGFNLQYLNNVARPKNFLNGEYTENNILIGNYTASLPAAPSGYQLITNPTSASGVVVENQTLTLCLPVTKIDNPTNSFTVTKVNTSTGTDTRTINYAADNKVAVYTITLTNTSNGTRIFDLTDTWDTTKNVRFLPSSLNFQTDPCWIEENNKPVCKNISLAASAETTKKIAFEVKHPNQVSTTSNNQYTLTNTVTATMLNVLGVASESDPANTTVTFIPTGTVTYDKSVDKTRVAYTAGVNTELIYTITATNGTNETIGNYVLNDTLPRFIKNSSGTTIGQVTSINLAAISPALSCAQVGTANDAASTYLINCSVTNFAPGASATWKFKATFSEPQSVNNYTIINSVKSGNDASKTATTQIVKDGLFVDIQAIKHNNPESGHTDTVNGYPLHTYQTAPGNICLDYVLSVENIGGRTLNNVTVSHSIPDGINAVAGAGITSNKLFSLSTQNEVVYDGNSRVTLTSGEKRSNFATTTMCLKSTEIIPSMDKLFPSTAIARGNPEGETNTIVTSNQDIDQHQVRIGTPNQSIANMKKEVRKIDASGNALSAWGEEVTARDGEMVEYRVTFTYNSTTGTTLNNLTILDTVSNNANLGYVPGNNGGRVNYNAGSITTNVGNLTGPLNSTTGSTLNGVTSGQAVTLTYKATASTPSGTTNGSIANNIARLSASGLSFSPACNNAPTTACDDAGVKLEVPPVNSPILTITKSVDKSTAYAGEVLNYTIFVQNAGTATAAATGLTIEDDYPESHIDVNNSSITNPGSNSSNSLIRWENITIPIGQSVTYRYSANIKSTVPVNTQITNIATLKCAYVGQCPKTSSANVSVSALPPVEKFKEIKNLTKNTSGTGLQAHADDVIEYTLKVKNNSTVSITDDFSDTVTDVLKHATRLTGTVTVGGTNYSESAGATWSADNTTLTWSSTSVAPGATIEKKFYVKMKNPVTTDTDMQMTNTFGNTVVANLVLPGNTFVRSKFVNGANAYTANPGETITFTLITENRSTNAGTTTVVDDFTAATAYATLDPTSYIACTTTVTSGCATLSGNTLTWANISIGGQNQSGSYNAVTHTFKMIVKSPIAAASSFTNTYGNTVTVNVNPSGGNTTAASYAKTIRNMTQNGAESTGTVNATTGDIIEYKITATAGSNPLTNYQFNDNIAVLVNYMTVESNGGATRTGDNLVWPVMTINAGTSQTKTFTMKVTSLPSVNTNLANTFEQKTVYAALPASNGGGGTIGTCRDNDDLSISLRADRREVEPGDIVTYTIKVRNNGTTTLRDINLESNIDRGYIVEGSARIDLDDDEDVSGTDYDGGIDKRSGITLTELKPGGIATIEFEARASNTGNTRQNITLDTELCNGEDDDVLVTILPKKGSSTIIPGVPDTGNPDVKITKVANKTSAKPGEEIVYTVTVQNTGTSDASAVEVTDVLPSGTSFLNSSLEAQRSGNNLKFNVGNLAPGESTRVSYVAKVDQGVAPRTTLENQAQAHYSDPAGEQRRTLIAKALVQTGGTTAAVVVLILGAAYYVRKKVQEMR